MTTRRSEPRLVCLLPARNAAADLPDYFASVARFADAVVALDDGSTDDTGDVLENHQLVEILLRNPRRESYAGWDDAANRNRLLSAAAEFEPDWVISLDADERIDPGDGAALRDFVRHDALAGLAYGFRVFRMVETLERFDPARLWVYRLFAFEPGQVFPSERLHFVPIPTTIPRERWLQTTIRIQHFGSLTEQRRRARFAKYEQADAERTFQRSYELLRSPPADVRSWATRPAELPVLVQRGGESARDGLDLDSPVLSAIVISQNDEARIERAVRSVVEQRCPEPFEVIVVTSGSDCTAAIVRHRFPGVRLVELSRPALPGAARNAGLRLARGEYVTFPGSHVELPQGSLAARIKAHDLGFAMVTAATVNGTHTRSGWASYFLDHGTVLPGRPSGVLKGPPGHCSYRRDLLLELGGFPPDMRTGEDTVVNRELTRRGYAAYRSQDVRIVHHSPCTSPLRLLRHHFLRGRGMARILLDDHRDRGGLLRRANVRSQLNVRLRIARTSSFVEQWGEDLRPIYRRVFPLVAAAALATWGGACYELLRPARGKLRILLRGPSRLRLT